MANNSKTFAEYTPCTSPIAADILVITSNVSGNAVTMQLSVENLLTNSTQAVETSNVTANVVSTPALLVTTNITPANSADLQPGIYTNSIWADANYIYHYDGTNIKRAALTTF